MLFNSKVFKMLKSNIVTIANLKTNENIATWFKPKEGSWMLNNIWEQNSHLKKQFC